MPRARRTQSLERCLLNKNCQSESISEQASGRRPGAARPVRRAVNRWIRAARRRSGSLVLRILHGKRSRVVHHRVVPPSTGHSGLQATRLPASVVLRRDAAARESRRSTRVRVFGPAQAVAARGRLTTLTARAAYRRRRRHDPAAADPWSPAARLEHRADPAGGVELRLDAPPALPRASNSSTVVSIGGPSPACAACNALLFAGETSVGRCREREVRARAAADEERRQVAAGHRGWHVHSNSSCHVDGKLGEREMAVPGGLAAAGVRG